MTNLWCNIASLTHPTYVKVKRFEIAVSMWPIDIAWIVDHGIAEFLAQQVECFMGCLALLTILLKSKFVRNLVFTTEDLTIRWNGISNNIVVAEIHTKIPHWLSGRVRVHIIISVNCKMYLTEYLRDHNKKLLEFQVNRISSNRRDRMFHSAFVLLHKLQKVYSLQWKDYRNSDAQHKIDLAVAKSD